MRKHCGVLGSEGLAYRSPCGDYTLPCLTAEHWSSGAAALILKKRFEAPTTGARRQLYNRALRDMMLGKVPPEADWHGGKSVLGKPETFLVDANASRASEPASKSAGKEVAREVGQAELTTAEYATLTTAVRRWDASRRVPFVGDSRALEKIRTRGRREVALGPKPEVEPRQEPSKARVQNTADVKKAVDFCEQAIWELMDVLERVLQEGADVHTMTEEELSAVGKAEERVADWCARKTRDGGSPLLEEVRKWLEVANAKLKHWEKMREIEQDELSDWQKKALAFEEGRSVGTLEEKARLNSTRRVLAKCVEPAAEPRQQSPGGAARTAKGHAANSAEQGAPVKPDQGGQVGSISTYGQGAGEASEPKPAQIRLLAKANPLEEALKWDKDPWWARAFTGEIPFRPSWISQEPGVVTFKIPAGERGIGAAYNRMVDSLVKGEGEAPHRIGGEDMARELILKQQDESQILHPVWWTTCLPVLAAAFDHADIVDCGKCLPDEAKAAAMVNLHSAENMILAEGASGKEKKEARVALKMLRKMAIQPFAVPARVEDRTSNRAVGDIVTRALETMAQVTPRTTYVPGAEPPSSFRQTTLEQIKTALNIAALKYVFLRPKVWEIASGQSKHGAQWDELWSKAGLDRWEPARPEQANEMWTNAQARAVRIVRAMAVEKAGEPESPHCFKTVAAAAIGRLAAGRAQERNGENRQARSVDLRQRTWDARKLNLEIDEEESVEEPWSPHAKKRRMGQTAHDKRMRAEVRKEGLERKNRIGPKGLLEDERTHEAMIEVQGTLEATNRETTWQSKAQSLAASEEALKAERELLGGSEA